jgi:cellulose synthase/poly-beta-1,6-N-acetylglucosamine synthase-like glycosyltransferase
MIRNFFAVYQWVVLGFFAFLNLSYGLFGYLGLRNGVVRYSRLLSGTALKDLAERDVYKPVSILVPAFNEERTCVASVHSFLSLSYPEFEVIVVSDGSTDGTMQRLTSAFDLVEQDRIWQISVESRPIRTVYRSLKHPNLLVIDKENGGKADALNAALNVASFPLIAAVDADSLLDAEAMLRATRLFVEDETLVALGGTVRPINGAIVEDGRVVGLRMPSKWLERFQVLEYARAFFAGRSGWSHFDALLIISGAFGLFKRASVIAVGGYSTVTVCEDMEMVVRLHRYYRERKEPYRITSIPDPICWTEVPSDVRTLRRQRNRWQRGLWETLWLHRSMMLNPKYGRLGVFAVPYFWIFEALAPVIEVVGYVMLPIGLATGYLDGNFALLFLSLAIVYGMLLSQLAMGIETFLLSRYSRLSDRVILFVAAFLENFGYRQMLVFERFVAMFQVIGKKGHWGQMERTGFGGAPLASKIAPPAPPTMPPGPMPPPPPPLAVSSVRG